jgi:di/tripeptidase
MKSKQTKKAKKSNNLVSAEMANINSEFIKSVSYKNGNLIVEMRRGTYQYSKVNDDIVKAFLAAPSFGTFFNENIRHLKHVRLDE